MKPDALPSPGLFPNAGMLRKEIVKTVSYLEVQADLIGARPTQADQLQLFITALQTYLTTKEIGLPPE